MELFEIISENSTNLAFEQMLLTCKLKRGVGINKYIPSFGDGPNEVGTIVY